LRSALSLIILADLILLTKLIFELAKKAFVTSAGSQRIVFQPNPGIGLSEPS
jgi:hypothetical protein